MGSRVSEVWCRGKRRSSKTKIFKTGGDNAQQHGPDGGKIRRDSDVSDGDARVSYGIYESYVHIELRSIVTCRWLGLRRTLHILYNTALVYNWQELREA